MKTQTEIREKIAELQKDLNKAIFNYETQFKDDAEMAEALSRAIIKTAEKIDLLQWVLEG